MVTITSHLCYLVSGVVLWLPKSVFIWDVQGNGNKTIVEDCDEIVQLPLVDSEGRAAPGAFGRDAFQHLSSKRSKKDNFDADGSRKRYFDDDDDHDLDTLVKRTR